LGQKTDFGQEIRDGVGIDDEVFTDGTSALTFNKKAVAHTGTTASLRM
jgi:hypothetical protein